MKEVIEKEDLFFHSVHGLCRVAEKTLPNQENGLSYTFVPVTVNTGKVKFVVPESALENAGFNRLISSAEGSAILEFFKTGKKRAVEESQAWKLAVMLWTEACSKHVIKDGRKRNQLNRLVQGLTGELSVALEMTAKEIAVTIQENLKAVIKINPFVLTALASVGKI